MDRNRIARLSNFKIKRQLGRIINGIERFYRITPSDEPNKEYSLEEVMELIAVQNGLPAKDCENTRYFYIENRIKEHPRKPQGSMILKALYSCGLLGLIAAVFVKFVYFRLYPASLSVELSVCGGTILAVGIAAYIWKFYGLFSAIKKGEFGWVEVVEFYSGQKRYYKNIGSDRANRTNNFENDDMYLHCLCDGKDIHLPVEYGLYKQVCDLKRIPVFKTKNKVYIDEYSVNIEKLQWREKE